MCLFVLQAREHTLKVGLTIDEGMGKKEPRFVSAQNTF